MFDYDHLSLSVSYSTVLFPFNEQALLRALPQHGYVVTSQLPVIPFGSWLTISGDIAKKGDITLRIHGDRRLVGLHAPDPSLLLEEFTNLEQLLLDVTGFHGEGSAAYYEVLAQLSVKRNISPLATVARISRVNPVVLNMESVLGEPLAAFGVRLVSSHGNPNGTDWLEMRLEPAIAQADTHLFIAVVYRNPGRQQATAFLGTLEDRLQRAMETLEQMKAEP